MPKPPLRPGSKAQESPAISVIICGYNEAGVIAGKLANTMALRPLPHEIVVVADGSEDGTERVAQEVAIGDSPVPVRVLFSPERRGKAHAMNRGAQAAVADILCFTDANAMLSPDALAQLAAKFGDPSVALVSGAKHVHAAPTGIGGSVATGDSAYWRYESFIRQQESRLGATVAAVGELTAIRARDWTGIPPGVVNDDAWLAMHMLSRGRNVRYAPDAHSWEEASAATGLEVERRRRINTGRLKLIFRKDVWPLRRPFVMIAFLSHKVLRLVLPFLFVVSWLSSAGLWLSDGAWSGAMGVIALAHLAVVLAAALHPGLQRIGKRWKPASIAFHILSSYAAIVLAWLDLAKRKDAVLWSKPAR
ncbi:glycosyltransferase [Primorskyibacter aestuariivivens]|uniref:glycosyltransferase n=1 Tax=Primorskyibacter aestuariivivens TaxID=1888912 RepID=UPI002300EE62|nr:glycosyltransferase [Primorskyibacter aestuariivivens]MDA7429630.1 glycosyltransferase [Primorskyibacter aestuariivivens]